MNIEWQASWDGGYFLLSQFSQCLVLLEYLSQFQRNFSVPEKLRIIFNEKWARCQIKIDKLCQDSLKSFHWKLTNSELLCSVLWHCYSPHSFSLAHADKTLTENLFMLNHFQQDTFIQTDTSLWAIKILESQQPCRQGKVQWTLKKKIKPRLDNYLWLPGCAFVFSSVCIWKSSNLNSPCPEIKDCCGQNRNMSEALNLNIWLFCGW